MGKSNIMFCIPNLLLTQFKRLLFVYKCLQFSLLGY